MPQSHQVNDRIENFLQDGYRLHQAGYVEEAEKLYRAVLREDGDNLHALNLLGMLCVNEFRPDEAVPLLTRAIKQAPRNPETHANDYTIDTEAHEPGGPYKLPIPLARAGPSPAPTPAPPPVAALLPTQIGASNCMSCHTDRPSLEALAVEEEEVKSEETSGEG